MAVLEGILQRVVFSSDESGFCVVRLAVQGEYEPVTAVGNLLGVRPGETLRLTGEWENDRAWGRQFRAISFLPVLPSTRDAIERYLGSGMIKGIGKAMASRLVERFGLATLQTIEQDADRLREVAGIGPSRAESIRRAWTEQKGIRDVMLFLQGHGISANWAARIYKRYGARSIAVVRENPYQLAEDISGIGFLTADRIAAGLGVEPTSPHRARAGILYLLGEHAESGHVFCPSARLVELATQELSIDAPRAEQALEHLVHTGKLVRESDPGEGAGGTESVGAHAAGDRVYLRDLHTDEVEAARLLLRLRVTAARPIAIDVARAVEWIQHRSHLTLAPQQVEALGRVVTAKVLVLTGGPGTGKTTLVLSMLQILEKKGRRVVLCAPTGRAARRLADTTQHPASTIHRLLEFQPRTADFARGPDHPLDADVLVVDEMSMVDLPLFHALLCALPARSQLVLVGDVDQLPSVGPGAVLADLIRSRAVDVVALDHVFRQAQRSQIVVNAHLIHDGQLPLASDEGSDAEQHSDFFFVEREEPEQILAALEEMVLRRIPRRFGLDPRDDVQVLTPMHKGLLGAQHLNERLQLLLNPGDGGIARGGAVLRPSDKVMQVRNDYEREVFNGDIGRVLEVDEQQQLVVVGFDGRPVEYQAADLDALVLAYACSIHKAQGSEYPAVVIPLHTQHYALLQRNLLYTAVTRGRKLVVLVGSRKAVALAVRNDRTLRRMTWLAERLASPGQG